MLRACFTPVLSDGITPLTVPAQRAAAIAPGHRHALRMGVIAGVSHNVVIGAVMGSFGVLLAPVQERLRIETETASLGITLVVIASAVMSPFAGVLVARLSIRLLLQIGALMITSGFLLLAATRDYALYLVAYGILLGPAMSVAGSVGPATLVTRWFDGRRGLVLGIVHLPIFVSILPVALNWFVERNGVVAAYLLLATIVIISVMPLTFLVLDHPPRQDSLSAHAASPTEPPPATNASLSVFQLLARPRFWAIMLAAKSSMTSSVLLSTMLIPMGVSWGFTRAESAFLASIMALSGILGSVLFGWIADRIGGARTLALIALDSAALWALLLGEPSYGLAAMIVGLLGLHGAGVIPALSRAIGDAFSAASFSRGFGLVPFIGLPFLAVAITGSASVYTATGSYDPAVSAMVAFCGLAVVLALYAATSSRQRRRTPVLN